MIIFPCRHTDRIMDEVVLLHGVKNLAESVLSMGKEHFEFTTEFAEGVGLADNGLRTTLEMITKSLETPDSATTDQLAKIRTQLSAINGLLTETLKVHISFC